MSRRAKDNRPDVKPVKSIELSESKKRLRIIAVVILIALGIGSITFALVSLLNKESGWTKIEPADDNQYSVFFDFNYNIGASGASATAEYKRAAAIYDEALNKYCKLVSSDTEHSGIANLLYISKHPGEEITVDPVLYSALERSCGAGNRSLYLAPVYDRYNALFSCDADGYAAMHDPYKNEDAASFCDTVSSFACDPATISLSFLGDGKLRLDISEEYRAYAESVGIESYISFGWLENAVVVDAIARELISEGMTLGVISSYDGFTRNLDDTGADFSFTVYDKLDDTVYPAADVKYNGSVAMVNYRSYPLSQLDALDYYLYADGKSAHQYIDSADGRARAATDNMLVFSFEADCLDLALSSYDAYISDELSEEKLSALGGAIYFIGTDAYVRGEGVELYDLYSSDGIEYKIAE